MTADDIAVAKMELEVEIAGAIQKFTRNTGFSVEQVSVDVIEVTSFSNDRPAYILGGIRVRVAL